MLLTIATYLTDHNWPAWCGITLGLVYFFLKSQEAAYHNGVTDGYGYAREPWNRGYFKAGDYLRRFMSHRWPEVNAKITLGENGYHSHYSEHDLDQKHGDAANDDSEFPLESSTPPSPPSAA